MEYEILDELGKGGYGTVYKVKKDENYYALKIITSPLKEGIKSLRELDVMTRLEHPNLMKAEKIIVNKNLIIDEINEKNFNDGIEQIGILMQLAERDLHKANYDKNLSFENRLNIMQQILSGLLFLHSNNYLHLDLKPMNILLFPGNVAKITDFGLSLVCQEINMEKIEKYYPNALMTITYRSPEVLQGSRIYTEKDDIWSLGLVYLEILSGGRYLFDYFKPEDFTDKNVLNVFLDKLGDKNRISTITYYLDKSPFKKYMKPKMKQDLIKLLNGMLQINPSIRYSDLDVVNSPIFRNFKKLFGNLVSPIRYKIECSDLFYTGFDYLVRAATNIDINTETFFLAADMYQRAFPFHNPEADEPNIIYLASICLYMSIKMIEPFYADPDFICNLSKNKFTSGQLILGEAYLSEFFYRHYVSFKSF
jgi:serine/threonine protein kinase